MQFARRDPRLPMHCQAMLTLEGGETRLGEVVDLSVHGAAVVIPGTVRKETPVSLLLDPGELPDPCNRGGLPSLRGVVRSVARTHADGSGMLHSRVGIAFTPMRADTESRLRELTGEIGKGTRPPQFGGDGDDDSGITRELAQTSRGCERLFQVALSRLSRGELGPAREAAVWAWEGARQNRAYRALVLRCDAEKALAEGQVDAALRAVEEARSLAPRDREWLALEQRVHEAQRKERRGFLARLLGR